MTDDIAKVVEESADALLERHSPLSHMELRDRADRPEWDTAMWRELCSNGLPFALLTEERGGVGLANGLVLARLAGARAVTWPLPEAMAANWLLSQANLQPAERPIVFSDGLLTVEHSEGRWHARGILSRVTWGRSCDIVARAAGPDGSHLIVVHNGEFRVDHGSNIAGEPRDTCSVDCDIDSSRLAQLPQTLGRDSLRLLGAALRTAQLAGAMDSVVGMTVNYARERRQFGRAIGSFQAIQQLLAMMAGQAAASRVAADLACEGVVGGLLRRPIAIGKSRASEAAGAVASGAHQIHGAMGFTREHALQWLTRRLWSWRDEFGSETAWSVELGRATGAIGSERLWHELSCV